MSQLTVKLENYVAVITLDGPPFNFLSIRLLEELERLAEQLEADHDCKVLVITGQGKNFTAGMNVKEIQGVENLEQLLTLSGTGHRVFRRIENLTKPVIAAINGQCFGGGTELILACHLRIASDDAAIALPEIKLGMLPGFGGTQRLPRLINMAKALEIILTGDSISGEEAMHIGLVNRTVPREKLLEETLNLANSLAEKSRYSLKEGLRTVYEGLELPMDQALNLERELVTGLLNEPDMLEGLQAFFEKRKPNYQ